MSGSEIVVGVDGSPESLVALQWAVDEAMLRNCPVRAVGIVDIRVAPGASVGEPMGSDPVGETAQVIEDAVKAVSRDGHDVDIKRDIITGHPAHQLVELGKDAEMLVVGRRGHSALAGLLMGSVALQVSAHASCPVVVVREKH